MEGVLKNDTDLDGDTLQAVLANQPTHGILDLKSDGSFIYTPNQNFSGSDSFAYRVSDGTVESEPISVTLTVDAADDVPNAVADSYTVAEDQDLVVAVADGVLANDSDPDGDISASVLEAPLHGELTFNPDGSFTYIPDPNFTGPDSFTYSVTDGVNQSIAAATITVTDQPDDPTANDDTFEIVDDGSSQALDVLANDTFAPDTNDTLTVVSVSQGSQGGNVQLDGGVVMYQPAEGFVGTETFDYTIEDSSQLQQTATVTVTVTEGGTNTISGYTYLDSDGDGQRDAGEIGIPGVLITLSGTTTAGTAVNRTTLSTNSGLYVFDEVPAGTYRIIERQPSATFRRKRVQSGGRCGYRLQRPDRQPRDQQ